MIMGYKKDMDFLEENVIEIDEEEKSITYLTHIVKETERHLRSIYRIKNHLYKIEYQYFNFDDLDTMERIRIKRREGITEFYTKLTYKK